MLWFPLLVLPHLHLTLSPALSTLNLYPLTSRTYITGRRNVSMTCQSAGQFFILAWVGLAWGEVLARRWKSDAGFLWSSPVPSQEVSWSTDLTWIGYDGEVWWVLVARPCHKNASFEKKVEDYLKHWVSQVWIFLKLDWEKFISAWSVHSRINLNAGVSRPDLQSCWVIPDSTWPWGL